MEKPAAAGHSSQADVRKKGFLKKMKKMKAKFFVLREASNNGPARLEYYDSEKKFKNPNSKPKRSICLASCLAINTKSDAKHKWAITLYTKDDLFSIVADGEAERMDWLEAMLEVRNSYTEGAESLPLFEHVWPVTVRAKGLGNSHNGSYRLCLTNSSLNLVKPTSEQPDIDFPLACVRRCGHTDNFFFLEVGRTSKTGPGEIWMQVEDTMIAQSMHEVLLNAMKSSPLSTEQQPKSYRKRSQSNVDPSSKPIMKPRKQTSIGYDSSTLPHSLSRSVSVKPITLEQPRSPLKRRHSHSPNKITLPTNLVAMSISSCGHSPVSSCPLSSILANDAYVRNRTDSMESWGSHCTTGSTTGSVSADDLELGTSDHFPSSGGASTRSVTPEGPTKEETTPHYFPMRPTLGASSWTSGTGTGHTKDIMISTTGDTNSLDTSPYFGMTPTSQLSQTPSLQKGKGGQSEETGYIDMSPGTPVPSVGDHPYIDMSTPTSSSTSSEVSSANSCQDPDDDPYLSMTPELAPHSLPKMSSKLQLGDHGYLDMTCNNRNQGHSGSGSSLQLDKVHSYLIDDTFSGSESIMRCYSVGSRPTLRAKTLHESYLEMGGPSDLDGNGGHNRKTSSAPHLPKDHSMRHMPSTSSSSDAKRDLQAQDAAHFMELDFQLRGDGGV